MGHTNSTANLSLPQFIGTDKPTWLGDVNGAFSAIDSYAGTNDAAVTAAASDASSAISQAAAAVNTANTANTTAGNASTAATAAVTAANQANALSNQVSLRTGVLADLHTTDKTSIVNAINEVKDAEGDLTLLVTTDKSDLVSAINEVSQGGSSAITKRIESAANQTFAAQLTELKTVFDTLTDEEKRRSFIIIGDSKYSLTDVRGGYGFFRVNGTDLQVNTIWVANSTAFSGSITVSGTYADISSTTNALSMSLYA